MLDFAAEVAGSAACLTGGEAARLLFTRHQPLFTQKPQAFLHIFTGGEALLVKTLRFAELVPRGISRTALRSPPVACEEVRFATREASPFGSMVGSALGFASYEDVGFALMGKLFGVLLGSLRHVDASTRPILRPVSVTVPPAISFSIH